MDLLSDLPLVDHHCHGVLKDPVDRDTFEQLLTEAADPGPPGAVLDSQIGVAVRRWCAPVLDLPEHAGADDYLARRDELGVAETSRRLLRAAGYHAMLVDTGLRFPATTLVELAAASGATVREVVRLERVAERVAESGVDAKNFADAFVTELREAARGAVGTKSIVAYRYGLDFDPRPPEPREVREAASRWLAQCARDGRYRLDDPVLIRHAIWRGVGLGLPLQFHTGYGDPDLTLHRCDPLLLTDFIRMVAPTGIPVVLLHGYPYHRNAAYLANVFPHVYADVGLAVNHVGPRAETIIAETLELTPFPKLLYSSDGFALPEAHYLGAVLFRRGLGRLLGGWVSSGDLHPADAERYARMIGSENARQVYRLR